MRNIAWTALILALAVAASARAAEPQKPAAEPQKPAAEQPQKEGAQAAPPTSPHGGAPGATGPQAAPKPMAPAEVNKTLYGVGLAVAKSLDIFSLTPGELDTVVRGIRDGWAGKPKEHLDPPMQASITQLARERAPKSAERAAAREKALAGPYLAKMAKEKGAKKTPSGAIVIPEVEGSGASPKPTDKVKVNYTGRLVNGDVFDSSAGRGPTELPLDGVVKCWGEGLQQMKVGGKAKLVCPPETAYGEHGSPPAVPGNAVLTFDVELLDIVK